MKSKFSDQTIVAESIRIATKMSPSSPCHAEKDTHGLFLLPPEVITKIFGNLSSFLDVFALAATCRRLRSIWSTSVIPIYDSVAPRSIACERDARRFLVDQGGLGLVSPMTAETVVQMVRNAGIVEHAILQFEHEIVWRVRGKFTLVRFNSNPHIQSDSRWMLARKVLWCGVLETSSDHDKHRTHTFHTNLLFALGPDEARSC